MNLIEQTLAKSAGLEFVIPGDRISIEPSIMFAHDGSAPKAIREFQDAGYERVVHPDRAVFCIDHCLPAASAQIRTRHMEIKEFCSKHGIHLYDKGEGIIHQVLAENWDLKQGMVIVGADGHACTAGAFGAVPLTLSPYNLAGCLGTGKLTMTVPETIYIEISGQLQTWVTAKDVILYLLGYFNIDGLAGKGVIIGGNTLERMNIDERMTIANMISEMGGMIGMISPLGPQGQVEKVIKIRADDIPVSVAKPFSPGNVTSLQELEGVELTQVYIGGCTNGRLSDMKLITEILNNKKIKEHITLVVAPASREVANEMDQLGYSRIIRDSGGIIVNPGCGACHGMHQGVLDSGDVIVTTTAKNTPGRMGDKDAKIYIVSPAVAAVSALNGRIPHKMQ